VQHHHAHIASCLADNDLDEKVIGVAFDGTGYGADGRIWGGEFIIADCERFTRIAHLEYLPLPGGELAIKKPYRTAIGYLQALGIETDMTLLFLKDIDPVEIDVIKSQLEKNINAPLTSSLGRLFDAVAALMGLRGVIEYEAQAAIDLEMLAMEADEETGDYPFATVEQDGVKIIKIRDLIAAIIKDTGGAVPGAKIAARFHNTIARMILVLCQSISKETSINKVALSGGVFQNRLLSGKAITLLESAGLTVFTHRQVPCNDGGISLGQAVIAQHNHAI
jgi:hydrogenase maturation protein HypF